MTHPFDRYASFTDVLQLNEASAQPLRKSVRVNTLKMSVEDFKKYAGEKRWELTEVPWCPEGFFVDRPLDSARGDKRQALGKDLLHLLGHIYMQEAASMLPVALLDPKPGEMILDLSAAPGSKTTQIAARMQGSGVIIGNDLQEKRLHTLIDALCRSGVINAIVTKKNGQAFGELMTERFDRVLIDAPCTAQGTIRKDPDALNYTSEHGIRKAAALQRELLESAILATKVGGRIVYSTCTLTPEENEGVVMEMLRKFQGRVDAVDPSKLIIDNGKLIMNEAIYDSAKVQDNLKSSENYSLSIINFPFLRLWPQSYDTEGFFCAVLEKRAPTLHAERKEAVPRQGALIPSSRRKEISAYLEDRFGSSFLEEGKVLVEERDGISLMPEEVFDVRLPLKDYRSGLPFGKRTRDASFIPDHDLVTLRGCLATKNIMQLHESDVTGLLQGKNIECPETLSGHVILRYGELALGLGKAKDGILKNNLPRWIIGHAG